MKNINEDAKEYHQQALDKVKNTPEPEGQKFHIGQRVWIGELPINMRFFPSKCFAKVLYTYAHAYHEYGERTGRDARKSYCLDVDGASVSWYEEEHLSGV